ncbi:hypothetical protein Tco_0418768 [Tanacetum coccineum]
MSEPMPTLPTQSPFTYPNPNSSASPSFTQDDTFMPNPSASPSFTQDDTFMPNMPEPIQPMPTFTQTAFSQPAVHTQHTHPAQTNSTGQQYPNNVQSQQFQQFQTATISANNAKFPYLEKEKYEIWAMKMEYWIQNADHNLWRIVQQGNSPKRLGKDAKGNTIVHPPVSLDEHVAVQRENKVRTLLLQALPEDHMPDFHHYDDARDIWMAVKARFGGNEESKKMKKTMLKQQFAEFSVTEEEGLHKGYDRFQKILSQLNQVQARPDSFRLNNSKDKYVKEMPTKFDMASIHLIGSLFQEIFKYLKGHQNSACGTLKDSPFQLVCLQVTLIMLVLMVIGIHIQVGVNFWAEVISWQCKEAGLIVVLLQEASMLCCLLLWPGTLGFRNQFAGLWNQLHEYQSLIANQSTICIVKNPVFLSGPSILRLGNHFYRDANEKKNVIQVLKILTDIVNTAASCTFFLLTGWFLLVGEEASVKRMMIMKKIDDLNYKNKWQSMVVEMKIEEIVCSKREVPARV